MRHRLRAQSVPFALLILIIAFMRGLMTQALAPVSTFSFSQLQPAYWPESARMINVNLAAGTYGRGTVLGQVTDTEAAAVQTLALTGVPTGGSFTFIGSSYTSGVSPNIVIPYNATAAVAQPLFDAVYGPGNTKITGGALPGTALIVTFIGELAAQPVAAITLGTNSLTGGTTPNATVTQTTTGLANAGTFGAYAHGNSDGTQIAKGLLMYPCTVDAAGNITISAEIPGFTQRAAPMYYRGSFRTEDLVGLPTSGNFAVDFPGAVVSIGDLASGVITIS